MGRSSDFSTLNIVRLSCCEAIYLKEAGPDSHTSGWNDQIAPSMPCQVKHIGLLYALLRGVNIAMAFPEGNLEPDDDIFKNVQTIIPYPAKFSGENNLGYH